jgi:hypothetical protein
MYDQVLLLVCELGVWCCGGCGLHCVAAAVRLQAAPICSFSGTSHQQHDLAPFVWASLVPLGGTLLCHKH